MGKAGSGRQGLLQAGVLAGFIFTALIFAAGAPAQDAGDAAATTQQEDPSVLATERMPLATDALVLDLTDSDSRAIAVGERGHVLVSESRQDWRQVEGVPTRSTLTAVTAVGDQVWAVGHDQVILHSADGGLSWERQYASLFDPDGFDDPANGAPLLDVIFLDASTGIAIGAYGLMLRTNDGGSSWRRVDITTGEEQPLDDEVDEAVAQEGADDGAADDSWIFDDEDLELDAEVNPHLNAITRTGDGSLFIAGERGSAFRSRDGGASWERLQLPYEGSMFGAIGYAGSRVLVFGLRGNALVSDDLGETWTAIDTGTELSLQGGAVMGSDGAVLVGNNGHLLWRKDASQPFSSATLEDADVLSAVLPVGGSGQLVVAGVNGLMRHSVN